MVMNFQQRFCLSFYNVIQIPTRYFYFVPPKFAKKASDPGIHLKEKEWQLEFHQIVPGPLMLRKPKICDKNPIKVKIKKGETYKWCSCGYCHTQPYCDFTCVNSLYKLRHRPLVFKAPKTTEVWLCMCKQTKNKPFCDGSHRCKEVQEAFDKN